MYKKTVTYTDYDGNERTEDFYFNLTKAELMKMEIGTSGGMAEMINRVINAQDGPTLISLFEELVLRAYGEKSPDGRRFMKNDEIRNAFKETEAYSTIFMELATNDEEASKFINGIVPADLSKSDIRKLQAPAK